ncbi:hypothetical protein GMORB2_6201 [Geosmithia morbida]|uniref:Uncharacterized protein n=1 Tax=Geosmithia morbida TaxID=1094350 RepID=A0A9P5D575_9HYPO|nr:uncharacterized protein GMORB2_6201 [Geosmithia morbida]KAF4123500.1 hypothetical protein GMORB2_6201 [Geosmithia morbida]
MLNILTIAMASAAAAATVPVTVPNMTITPGLTPSPTSTSTLTPTPTIYTCHMQYCDGSTSWCVYWGGLTSFDSNHGPLPGETRAQLGACTPAVVTVAMEGGGGGGGEEATPDVMPW